MNPGNLRGLGTQFDLVDKFGVGARGLVVGDKRFPTVCGPGTVSIIPPLVTGNGAYTLNYSGAQQFFAPWMLADNITVNGLGSSNPVECAGLAMRHNVTYNDGLTNTETFTGIDIACVSSGTNTIKEAYGVGAVSVCGTSTTTQAWGYSIAIQAAPSTTIVTASLFRGLTIQTSATIQNIVGLDLNNIGTGSVSTWAIQTGPNWPSYHRGSFLLGATAFPTSTPGGLALTGTGALVSNGSSTITFAASSKNFIDWLVADTFTFAGNQVNSAIFGLGVYPKFIASQGRTDEVAAGVVASPSFTGTDTYANVYGLNLNASVTASATAATGIQSNVVVSGGTTTTLTGFKFSPTVFGGTVTTTVGFDLTSLAGSTIWALNVGNYQSYHTGPLTLGGTSAPSYALDIQNGGSKVASIGLVNLPSGSPSNPASNNIVTFVYKGLTSAHYFYVIQFNNASTQRYLSLDLTGNAATWTNSASLPT